MTRLRTSLVTKQPIKAIITIAAVIYALAKLPFWLIYFISRQLRQHPQWTYRQAVMNEIFRAILHHISQVEVYTPIQLDEKNRFVQIKPSANRQIYHGLLDTPEIQPGLTGGTWYPTLYQRGDDEQATTTVILHFHGGAYVTGEGRPADVEFLATTLVKNIDNAKALLISYRLSSNENCHFPAALQDAVTAYHHLLFDQGISPSRIVLSGDSAGGGLVVSLLRHLIQLNVNNSSFLPLPSAALLFSPWLDLKSARDNPGYLIRNRNYKTDYIPGNFVTWGARTYIPPAPVSASAPNSHPNPHFSPLSNPFRLQKTRLWIHIGGLEILCDEGIAFATAMQKVQEDENGNRNEVQVYLEPLANHDILLIGNQTGWAIEAEKAARAAGEFIKGG